MPRTYLSEFGPEYHAIPAPFLNRAEFTDTSWHNNACPSFEHNLTKVTVFIDAIDPNERDNEGVERFVCNTPIFDDKGDVCGLSDDWFVSETDIDAALTFCRNPKAITYTKAK